MPYVETGARARESTSDVAPARRGNMHYVPACVKAQGSTLDMPKHKNQTLGYLFFLGPSSTLFITLGSGCLLIDVDMFRKCWAAFTITAVTYTCPHMYIC